MRVTMMLADAAQVADGKIYLLGGGWSVAGPGFFTSAVAIKVEADWAEATRSYHWELLLEDADGRQVLVGEENQPIEVRGDFTVTPNGDIPVGAPIDIPLAINFGPLPLADGERYVWRFVVDGETYPGATAGFYTRPAPSA
ncbi:MAG: hypothetical protein WCJ82_02910 [Actinomycetota bacterium]|jgi:hypothetical protein